MTDTTTSSDKANASADVTAAKSAQPKRRLPPLKALLAFEAASRHGSFAQGAEELAVTPSAVSHHIQQLEEFLQVQLFQRHAGRAVLTNTGRIYAREIELAFGRIAEATNVVAPQSQAGNLVIAAGPSFAAKWLQPRLSTFLEQHPGVKIRLTTLSDLDDLDAIRYDIAIAYGRPPLAQGDIEPLLVERSRPLCSPTLAAALGLRTPADLARATLIHSANTLTWYDYLRQIGMQDFQAANELWLDRSAMAIDAAVAGMGVILESQILTSQEVREGRLIAPFNTDFEVETTSYYLVRSIRLRSGTQISAFENWLRTEIAKENLNLKK